MCYMPHFVPPLERPMLYYQSQAHCFINSSNMFWTWDWRRKRFSFLHAFCWQNHYRMLEEIVCNGVLPFFGSAHVRFGHCSCIFTTSTCIEHFFGIDMQNCLLLRLCKVESNFGVSLHCCMQNVLCIMMTDYIFIKSRQFVVEFFVCSDPPCSFKGTKSTFGTHLLE